METSYQLEQNRILRIYPDDNAESPDTWGNTDLFLIYDHRQFTVKRKGFDPEDIAEWYQASFRTLDYDGYYVFPVAAYIHSGIVLSLTNSFDRQGWDTSVTGFILIKKELIENTKNLDANKVLDKNPLESRAKEYAQGLIETWNQYLSGDVWGFRVFKKVKYYKISDVNLENLRVGFDNDKEATIFINQFLEIAEETIEEEEEDSCWGFYGSDIKTNGILDHIQYKLLEDVSV